MRGQPADDGRARSSPGSDARRRRPACRRRRGRRRRRARAARRPARRSAVGSSRGGSGSVTSSHEPSRTLADRGRRLAVDAGPGRRRPGRPRPCATGRTAGTGRRRAAARPARRAAAATACVIGGRDRRPAPRRVRRTRCRAARRSRAVTAPQQIAESARLKTGQMWPSLLNRLIQSTTWPRPTPGARNSRSIRLPSAPPRIRPSATAQPTECMPPGGPHDDRDDDERDDGEQDGGAGADRERGAGVAGLDQVDRAAEQPHLTRAGRVG